MPNRLAEETSPYLLQHANNPVQWYPWGAAALEKARQEDKPIFLSIGYSACHWCHVMEHESFENEGIAKFLNENFVCIKVDREERPDLDQIYMNAVLALRNGSGGWPLSAFLTPDQDVFYGGTYWPPQARMGMPGFDQVLRGVLEAFQNKREAVVGQSKQITGWLNEHEPASEGELDETLLVSAVNRLNQQFDFEHGGFGSAPKFPHSMDLELLIRLSRRWDTRHRQKTRSESRHNIRSNVKTETLDEFRYPNGTFETKPSHDPSPESMLKMVRLNLIAMAQGGIYDHLGGGFARYSVDERWLVPHFEKMLYDNSLLAGAYLEMFADSHESFYAEVARETLDYVLGYLTDPAGPFYSTEDADSEGVEGKFYVWSKAEIESLLPPEIAKTFCALYDVTISGNFEGDNILNLPVSIEQFAADRQLDLSQLKSDLQTAKKTLLSVRDQRIRPGLDDKVLVSWNGLAIDSLARGSRILGEAKYYDAAARAARFLLDNLRREDGRLLHTWRHGVAKLDAYLDDYSCIIVALVSLYDARFDERWIDAAVELTEKMIEFFSAADGGFYFTASDHEALIARAKEFQDSSVPSGNSMAALALVRLGRLLGHNDWVDRAEQTAKAGLSLMQRAPLASGQMLVAVETMLTTPQEWVLVGERENELHDLKVALRQNLPHGATLICRSGDSANHSNHLDEVLTGKTVIDGQPTLYICERFSCQAPIAGIEAIRQRLAH